MLWQHIPRASVLESRNRVSPKKHGEAATLGNRLHSGKSEWSCYSVQHRCLILSFKNWTVVQSRGESLGLSLLAGSCAPLCSALSFYSPDQLIITTEAIEALLLNAGVCARVLVSSKEGGMAKPLCVRWQKRRFCSQHVVNSNSQFVHWTTALITVVWTIG